MQLALSLTSFTDGKNRSHFLLAGTTVTGTAWFADGTRVDVAGVRASGAAVAFTLTIDTSNVPDALDQNGQPILVGGLPAKKRITRLDLAFSVAVTMDSVRFPVLAVLQRFTPTVKDPAHPEVVDYGLVPGGWIDAGGKVRIANGATHPLLDASGLPNGQVKVNALLLDFTNPWMYVHRNNPQYQDYKVLSTSSHVTFKVFAHLGGLPLIWYTVVPDHLTAATSVAAHVFFSPADNAETQKPYDDKQYLARLTAFEKDGYALFKYLLPPLDDVDVRSWQSKLGPEVVVLRNVVAFEYVVDPTTKKRSTTVVSPRQWKLGAGFQRAVAPSGGSGTSKPAQILLLPQRAEWGTNGWATTAHLQAITGSVVDLLASQTTLLNGSADELPAKDKMILSCYSESGFDLWFAAKANLQQVKAIIAIEPQNLNTIQNDYRKKDAAGQYNKNEPDPPVGKDVIPDLLKNGAKVFLIGRHHAQYRPAVSAADLAQMRLLPPNPAVLFAYPPDPTKNDFIKYRVQRIVDPTLDPHMTADEQQVLKDLTARGLSGAKALLGVFPPQANADNSGTFPGDGVDRWYSHQFALSGGDEFKPDPSGLYDKPVSYRTFFQVAVQEIG